jgi:hypothetical protein
MEKFDNFSPSSDENRGSFGIEKLVYLKFHLRCYGSTTVEVRHRPYIQFVIKALGGSNL